MSLLKKMNNLDKLKNTVFTKFSIGNNITYDDKEDSKNINNLFNNLNKNNDLINDENTIKEDEDNYKLNNINLNNLKSRNTIKTIENKKNENIEQLKIGDIVIIISIIEYNLNESNKELENIINEGIVYPEIIFSKQLFCLPLSKLNDSHRCKSLFKRSLFRIETPQNFVHQYQFEKFKNSLNKNNNDTNSIGIKDKEYLKLLSIKALDEKKNNETEFLLNNNKKILFGTTIQLRNIFTNELLTVDLGYLSKENGCLDVALNPLGGKNSLLTLVPSNCLRKFGDPIHYNETFYIIPSCLEVKHYMHVKNTEDVKGNGFELNISRNESLFKLLLFESAELNRESSLKNEIKSTMVVKLYNSKYKGFLSACIYNIDKVLPKLKTNQKIKNLPLNEEYKSEDNSEELSSNTEENEEMEQSNSNIIKENNKIIKNDKNIKKDKKIIIFDNYIIKKKKKGNSLSNSNLSDKSNYVNSEIFYRIILDTKSDIPDNCLNYWEIQYEKPHEGKIIYSELPIRLRHIASGLYLAYDKDKKEILLTPKINDDSVFYIYNENKEKDTNLAIISEDQIYLKAKNSNMFLKIFENNKDKKKVYNFTLDNENKINNEAFVFKIELQNNNLIQMNYNSNLIINHLINLYEQINIWGMKETEGDDLAKVLLYDYNTALQGELNFKKMVEFYRALLIFVKIESESQEIINDINIFINFQNYYSDQGFLFFIINFILLFDSKTVGNRDDKRGYLESKEKVSPEKIARKHIGNIIEFSFSLLKIMIKNNKHCSKNILNFLYLFDELLINHQMETIEILVICFKNTFTNNLFAINNLKYSNDLISPAELDENLQKFNILTSTQYWSKKLKEIDEINKNILEQILYLKVLKRLCLNNDGKGILKSQLEITKDVYKNDFFPLKFGIDNNNNKPYVIFKVKNTNDEFFVKNPSLKEIKIENINNANTPMFYYTSFKDKYEIFINYICAVLDLYYASCASRNDINNHIMTDNKSVGLNIQHIYLVITDNKINIKIRKKYSRLNRILFIDSSQKERISINRFKIFIWNSEINQDKDILQRTYNWIEKDNKESNNKKGKLGKKNSVVKNNDNFFILRHCINNFFTEKDFFENLIDKNENNEGRIKFYKFLGFLKEILILTKESLDFGLWNLKDLSILIQNINSFFIVYKYYRKKNIMNHNKFQKCNNLKFFDGKINENEIKKLIQNYWLAKLVYFCLKSKNIQIKNRLFQIYDKILDIYNIILFIKEDCEKYMLMYEYKKWYNSGESLLNNMYMIKLYNIFINLENSKKFCSDISEKDYEILNDNYLFEILLSDGINCEVTEYKLFNKSFSIMINHLNNQFNFTNELCKLEIIVNEEDLTIFESLMETHAFIKKKIQNIEFTQITKNIPIQNIEYFKKSDKKKLIYEEKNRNNKNKDITTILDELTNKIDSEFIQKMKLVTNSKLNKIQNFCQVLEIYKTLINLLEFLLLYEENLNIFSKIFQFLYHFCYNNYVNQNLLKSYFNYFLLLMPRFNYIGEVLMEILNLYKEPKKLKKFIMIIFQRIKEFDLFCPEIIKILICMIFNNKKESISSNQIVIFQTFFDILKDNTFRIFLEENKIIENIDKIKNQVGDYIPIEKQFKSYINILEILSLTCINNKYCIINNRNIISIEELITILKSYNYPYQLKAFLLLFFKNVFYPLPSFEDIKIYDIKYFFEIFENFILKELIIFYFYCFFFIERFSLKKGIEPNDEFIKANKNCNNVNSLIINRIKEEPEIKDYLFLQKVNLDSLENSKSIFGKNNYITKNKNEEYMNFFILIPKNPYLEIQGLISFIYQMYLYIKENKIELSQPQKDIILLAKKRLNNIEDFLEKIENELTMDSLITDIEYYIQKCLSVFIYEDNDVLYEKSKKIINENKKENDKNQIKKIEDNAFKLLENLKEYMLLNETNLLKLFNLSENDRYEIEKNQFRREIKKILNDQINNEEISDTIKYLDKNNKGIINLKDLYIYFNKNKIKKIDKREQNISEYININSKLDDKSFKISSTFKKYLFLFHKIKTQIHYNNSLNPIISLINSEYNISNIIIFFSRILGYINKSENNKEKLFFIQFIHGIMEDKIYDIDERNEQINREKIEMTQLIFCYSGIIEFILKNLYKGNKLEIIYECICSLNLCLRKGNKNVQNTIYNYVNCYKNTYIFLSFLEWIISEGFNNIKERNNIFLNNNLNIENLTNNDYEISQFLNQYLRQNEINVLNDVISDKLFNILLSKNLSFYYKIPRFILLFIQLCCENNENFRQFFRDSEYNYNITDNIIKKSEKGNINIVNHIGTLLVNLLGFGPIIYFNLEIWKLTKEVFKTLIYLNEGPCEENQIALGLRQSIFSSINSIFENDNHLKNKDEISTRQNLLMSYSVKYIKSLISQKSLENIGEILLGTLDIYLLIEKLIDIYALIIQPNEKLLYNGEICNHIIKSDKKNIIKKINYLKKNECTKNKCKLNYISVNEMEFINTGFNIFFILTHLKDIFPDHQKLSLFDLNIDNSRLRQFLKVNQIKKRNNKEENKDIDLNKDFISYEKNNDFNFGISEIDIDNNNLINNNSFENEKETRKTLDNTEFIYSDMDLHEISVLEDNCCLKFFKCISCNTLKGKNKFINKKNKSFEIYKNNPQFNDTFANNIYLYSSLQINNYDKRTKKRFISKYKAIFTDTYIFYAKHSSSVEISIKNNNIKKYFQIPFIFIYLTKELKMNIINAWKSTYQKSSLREIFNKIEIIIQILYNKQKLRKNYLLIENIWPIEILSYILTILFNLVLFIFTTNNDKENCTNYKRSSCSYIDSSQNNINYKYTHEQIDYVIIIIIYIKLMLYFIIFIFTILKRYEIIKNNMSSKAEQLIDEYKEKKMKKYEGSLLYHSLNDFNESSINSYNYILVSLYNSKGLNLIFDFDIIFLMINITISFLSIFITPFLQIFSLFDILRQNSFLRDILFILFRQIKKLFSMIYVLLIIIFIFSVIHFFFMRQYYYSNDYMNIQDNEINLYCDTIYYCFISILHYGINPNNILVIGSDISRNNSIFFLKLVIDLFLFCVVFSLSISIFLSIIINSFKEFYEMINEKQKYIKERCFICGMPKYRLDREKKGWIYHYKREHNIFSYIYFLVELKNKKFDDCDGVEKYVKKCIEKEELIFLPIEK